MVALKALYHISVPNGDQASMTGEAHYCTDIEERTIDIIAGWNGLYSREGLFDGAGKIFEACPEP